MSTILKLAFVALLLNACVQSGRSAWAFYEFRDAVHEAVLFSGNRTPPEVRERILAIAEEQNLPVDPETVSVEYRGTQAHVTGTYVDPVHLVPGVFTYPWEHALDMDIRRTAF